MPRPPQNNNDDHSALLSLPTEMLVRILQYCDFTTLVLLRLTSEATKSIANERLRDFFYIYDPDLFASLIQKKEENGAVDWFKEYANLRIKILNDLVVLSEKMEVMGVIDPIYMMGLGNALLTGNKQTVKDYLFQITVEWEKVERERRIIDQALFLSDRFYKLNMAVLFDQKSIVENYIRRNVNAGANVDIDEFNRLKKQRVNNILSMAAKIGKIELFDDIYRSNKELVETSNPVRRNMMEDAVEGLQYDMCKYIINNKLFGEDDTTLQFDLWISHTYSKFKDLSDRQFESALKIFELIVDRGLDPLTTYTDGTTFFGVMVEKLMLLDYERLHKPLLTMLLSKKKKNYIAATRGDKTFLYSAIKARCPAAVSVLLEKGASFSDICFAETDSHPARTALGHLIANALHDRTDNYFGAIRFVLANVNSITQLLPRDVEDLFKLFRGRYSNVVARLIDLCAANSDNEEYRALLNNYAPTCFIIGISNLDFITTIESIAKSGINLNFQANITVRHSYGRFPLDLLLQHATTTNFHNEDSLRIYKEMITRNAQFELTNYNENVRVRVSSHIDTSNDKSFLDTKKLLKEFMADRIVSLEKILRSKKSAKGAFDKLTLYKLTYNKLAALQGNGDEYKAKLEEIIRDCTTISHHKRYSTREAVFTFFGHKAESWKAWLKLRDSFPDNEYKTTINDSISRFDFFSKADRVSYNAYREEKLRPR